MLQKIFLAVAISLIAASGDAHAGMERGDFTEILAIPALFPNGPRVFSAPTRGIQPRSGAAPYELGAGDEDQNPSGFNGYLEVDVEPAYAPSNPNTITLFHRETNTGYQSIRITIENIGFDTDEEFIADIALDFGSIIDEQNSDPFTETVLFTDDSITFIFEVNDMSPGQLLHLIPGGFIRYLFEIGNRADPIPEPTALTLSGAAFAGLALFRRRQQRR